MAMYGLSVNNGKEHTETQLQLSDILEQAAELSLKCSFWFDGKPSNLAFRQFAEYLAYVAARQ